jgi:hypothetical protein
MFLGSPGLPDVDQYRRFSDLGVTDFVVAPMHVYGALNGKSGEAALDSAVNAARRFTDEVIAKVS